MNTIVIVSTHNRRDITGICLSSLAECRHMRPEIHVIDDASTEYDHDWLRRYGAGEVLPLSGFDDAITHGGTGGYAMRAKLQHFLSTDAEVGLLFENDALVAPGYDVKGEDIAATCFHYGEMAELPFVGTLYRSTNHPAASPEMKAGGQAVKLEHIGGISLVVTRSAAQALLDAMPMWERGWDWHLHKVARIIGPTESWVEHIGRFGGGVHGESIDRAVNFRGYTP